MCLILFALHQHDDYPLVIIANRDEYYARPTQAAHWWQDEKDIFGGRDLEAKGTWMGINRNGRFAAVTNVREPGMPKTARLSRGNLPREFLSGNEPATDFVARIGPNAHDYAGFNLLIGDSSSLYFYSNRQPGVHKVQPGIHGVSNGQLNEGWPKLSSGKEALALEMKTATSEQGLMQILTDNAIAGDEQLPDTGVGLDIERMLSSRFIRSPEYGTRACSLVMFSRQRDIKFIEQNYEDAKNTGVRITEHIEILD